MKKIVLSWSGGKDSALSLWKISTEKQFQIAALITTVTREYDRISMHGVRRDLLELQASHLNIPLDIVWIDKSSDQTGYEKQMNDVLQKYKSKRISFVASGDLFLEEIRKYREEKLASIGMKAVFPLWGQKTSELSHQFIRAGFKAIVTCVDTSVLDASFAGKDYNEQFLSDLPSSIDPCGENGEFHTFVYDGPIFKKPVLLTKGEKVLRDDRFFFCDLVPAQNIRKTRESA